MSAFRASCDNCATSKVRCSKEQPYCQRCFRLGHICIYSPSQRTRRAPHRRVDSDHADQNQNQMTDPTAQIQIQNHNHNQGSRYLTPSLPLLGTTSTSATDIQNSMDTPDFMNMLDDATSNGGLFADFDDNHLTSSVQCDLTHGITGQRDDSHNHQESDSRGHKSLLISPDLDLGIDTTTLRSAGASSNASSRSASDEPGQQQHCELAILHMLMELGTPSPCRGRPRSSRDLGAILKTGRKTLACAAKVLECNTCPRSTNAALLVTTLLLHTLSWYELILQEQDTTTGSSSSTDNNSASTSGGSGDYDGGGGMLADDISSPGICFSEPDSLVSPSSDRNATMTGIVVPPMLIGSYELDAESQARMVCHVILGDLRKIDGLAKSVSARLRDAETAGAGTASTPASQAPDLVAAVIRQRHGRLLRVIEKKLEISGV